MANLAENINRAIADFDSIKTAIEGKGVDVGIAPTSEYADKISQIESGGGAEVLFSSDGHCYVKNIVLPESVTSVGGSAYQNCVEMISATLPDSIKTIGQNAFYGCRGLNNVNIPAGVTSVGGNAFTACTNITEITLGQGINCTGLAFSVASKLTAEIIVNMMTALADLTGQEAKTLTLGAKNLAKLTAEQKRIATDKNWNLA